MKKLAVCRSCGFPLVSTLCFSKAEYYCVNCGAQFGMLDVERKECDEKLLKAHKEAKDKFGSVRPYLIGGGARIRGCKKCDAGEYHIQHASEEELKNYENAMDKLHKWYGSFNWS